MSIRHCDNCAACIEPCGRTLADSHPIPDTFALNYNAHALRYNADKPDLTLIPPEALTAVADVFAFGAKKYGRDNFKKLWGKDTLNVLLASTYRHLVALQKGEDTDPESGLSHAAHAMTNLAMVIYAQANKREIR